ncbi:MAG: ArsR family transcriptional regulator [Trueperaceae bacterium]|nr:ArsR family transcriptional regulator [Trueperaceae bacterium]
MTTRDRLLAHLKRAGDASVHDLEGALELSENAVRHHLARLRADGLIEDAPPRRGTPGRPARRVRLTSAAEGHFPKRYDELLQLVLAEAEADQRLSGLLDRVAQRLADSVHDELSALPPRERLRALMERLDYGEMMGRLDETRGGWTFEAHNCVYYQAGLRFEPVCDLLPRTIRRATGLPAERVVCQRDGARACRFAGGFVED